MGTGKSNKVYISNVIRIYSHARPHAPLTAPAHGAAHTQQLKTVGRSHARCCAAASMLLARRIAECVLTHYHTCV